MASILAISAVSDVLVGLIRDSYPRAPQDPLDPAIGFPAGLEVGLYQPSNFESPMSEGFSVCLLRVDTNKTNRNLAPRRLPDGRVFRPSLPVDLHYLITPWARQASTQQRMLGWVMRFLEDLGTLSASHLNHFVPGNQTFGSNEALELISDPLALSDYLSVWERLRALPPSMTYQARCVLIDSDVGMEQGPPVQTRAFDLGELQP